MFCRVSQEGTGLEASLAPSLQAAPGFPRQSVIGRRQDIHKKPIFTWVTPTAACLPTLQGNQAQRLLWEEPVSVATSCLILTRKEGGLEIAQEDLWRVASTLMRSGKAL